MPTVKEINARIKKTQKDIEKLKSKLVKDTNTLFKQSLKEIFKDHSNLESFSWTQYTPYWNDGDTCTFSAHTDYIYLNDSEEGEGVWEYESLYNDLLNKDKAIKKLEADNTKLAGKPDNKWQIESNERKIKQLEEADINEIKWKYEALKDISELMNNIDQDTLLTMFDDHVKVTVTKNGIETESYQHD